MKLLLIFLFSLHSVLVHAETSGSSSSSGGSQSEAAPGTVVEVPDKPVVEPGTPPKAQDRAKSSAMAKAMALGGQAQSMIMCMQMQQEAQKQKNSSDKALMMMMANQACQQAAEMGKAAAEADKGQKAVSQEDIPKQSQLKLSAQKLPSGSAKEDTSAMSGYKIVNDEEASKAEEIPTGKVLLPDISGTKEEQKAVAATTPTPAPEEGGVAPPDLGRSVPGAIPNNKVSMSETDKNAGLNAGGLPLGPNLAGLGPNLAASGKSPAEEAKNLKGALTTEGEEGRSKSGGAMETGEGGGGGGGGGSSGNGEKGADPFEAMLAQLLGGPPAGEGGGGSSEDIVMAPRGEGKAPNIFEYATFRYVKLVDQKKLKGGKRELPGQVHDKIGERNPKGPSQDEPREAERLPASSPKLSKR